jgi:formiminotetrahydrofolate cyclodeaminase
MVTGVVLWFSWKLVNIIPTLITDYMKERRKQEENQEKRYQCLQDQLGEQIKIIIKISQQTNEVIARNNDLLEGNQKMIESIGTTLNENRLVMQEMRSEVKESVQTAQKAYTEVIRLGGVIGK